MHARLVLPAVTLLAACAQPPPKSSVEVTRQSLDVVVGAPQESSRLGEPQTTILGFMGRLSGSCGQNQCVLLWSDSRPGGRGVYSAYATFPDKLGDSQSRGLIAAIPGADHHVVAWQSNSSPTEIYAWRIFESATDAGPPVKLSVDGGRASLIGLGADETQSNAANLVVWGDQDQAVVKISRVDNLGAPLDPPGGVTVPIDPFTFEAVVVWDGVSYVIADLTGPFNDHDIELTAISRTGGPTGHRVLALPGDQTAVALERVRPGSMMAYTTRSITADGGTLSTLSWMLFSATSGGTQTLLDAGVLASSASRTQPHLTSADGVDAGEVVVVSWVEDAREVKGTTWVRSTGAFLPPATLAGQAPGAADCSVTQSAQNDAGCLLAYSDFLLLPGPSSSLPHTPQLATVTDAPLPNQQFGNVAAIVIDAKRIQRGRQNAPTELGPMFPPQTVSDQPAQQLWPSVAWAGSSYLVAWKQLTTVSEPFSHLDVRAERFDLDGLSIAPAFDAARLPDSQLQPAVAANDAGVLVAWTEVRPDGDTSTVKYYLMSPSGAPLSAVGSVRRAGAPQRWPGAGNIGDLFGLAWYDQGTLDGGPFGPGDLYFSAIDRSGQHLAISQLDDGVVREPAAFANAGAQGLVAWTRNAGTIRARRVSADGGVLDAAPIGICNAPAYAIGAPAAAFTGTEYVVIWADARAGAPGLYARRLSIDGAPAGPISGDLVAPGTFLDPSAAWDGHDVFVSWRDPLSDGGVVARGNWWRPGQAWDADGGVALFDGALLLSDTYARATVPVATNGQRSVMVVAQRPVKTFGQFNGARIYVQTLQTGRPRGLPCTAADECSTGFCGQGVCCDLGCTGVCQTCRVDAGALTEGQCGARAVGTFCGPSGGGICDLDDVCDGQSPGCPDRFAPSTKICHPAAVACDAPETCNGLEATCPIDRPALAGTECHPADPLNPCDVREVCGGNDMMCPLDRFAPEGTVCGDGKLCNAAGACVACVGAQCEVFDAGTMGPVAPTRSLYGTLQCSSAAGAGVPLLAALLAFALRRRRRFAGVLAVAVTLAAGGASAAEQRLSLAFMGLGAPAGAEEATKALSKLVENELGETGAYRIIRQDDLIALIGIERQRQLLGCNDDVSTCAAEIAGALNADRVLVGTVSQVAGETLFDLSLLDRSAARSLGRASRRIKGGVSNALDEVVPMLKELLATDPALAGRTLDFRRTFGGVVLGLRGEGDVLGRGFGPAVMVELSARLVGVSVSVLYGNQRFGGRLEGRFYPFIAGPIRPYLAAGASVLVPAVSVRGALGAAVMVWRLQLYVDVAYEHFFNVPATYYADALLIAGGVGWHF